MSIRNAIVAKIEELKTYNAIQFQIIIKQYLDKISKQITAVLYINNLIYVGTNDQLIYVINAENMSLLKTIKFKLKYKLVPYSVQRLIYSDQSIFVFFQNDIFQIEEATFDIIKHHSLSSIIIQQSIQEYMGIITMKLQNNSTVKLIGHRLSIQQSDIIKKVLSYQCLESTQFTLKLKNGTVYHNNKIIQQNCICFEYFDEVNLLATTSIPSEHKIILYQFDKQTKQFIEYDEILINISQTFTQKIILYQNILIIGTAAPKLQDTQPGLIIYDVIQKYEKWLNIPVQSSVCGNLSVHNINDCQIIVCGSNQLFIIELFPKIKSIQPTLEPIIQEGGNKIDLFDNILIFQSHNLDNDYIQMTPEVAIKYLESSKTVSHVKVTKLTSTLCCNQVILDNKQNYSKMVSNNTYNISQNGFSFNVQTPPLLNQSQGIALRDFNVNE